MSLKLNTINEKFFIKFVKKNFNFIIHQSIILKDILKDTSALIKNFQNYIKIKSSKLNYPQKIENYKFA